MRSLLIKICGFSSAANSPANLPANFVLPLFPPFLLVLIRLDLRARKSARKSQSDYGSGESMFGGLPGDGAWHVDDRWLAPEFDLG